MNVSDPEVLAAVLSYHVLKSVVRSSDFQTTPAFVPTLLESPRFTNVTGGQVVKGALNGTDVIVTSGALQTSKVIQAVRIVVPAIESHRNRPRTFHSMVE